MASDLFDGFEGREEEVEVFKKRDVSRHQRYLKSRFLTPTGDWNFSKQITLPMEIGPWIELKNGTRRGQNEHDTEQDFREAARQLHVGIKFGVPVYTRDSDGNPVAELRFKLEPQREFTEEAVNLRVLAQAVRLYKHWNEKPDTDADKEPKLKEAKVRLDQAVADARRINSPKTRDALAKNGIPVTAPTKKQASE